MESIDKRSNFDQKGYRVPKIAEAFICIAAEYFRSKKRLFNDETYTFIRCEGNGLEFSVGGFAHDGLAIHTAGRRDCPYSADDDNGITALREFRSH